MIYLLILLDFLTSNLTTYKTHLIILAMPELKSFKPVFIYFIFLSIFDFRYLFNLIVLFLIYKLDVLLNNYFGRSLSIYFLKVIIFYIIYFVLLDVFILIYGKIS